MCTTFWDTCQGTTKIPYGLLSPPPPPDHHTGSRWVCARVCPAPSCPTTWGVPTTTGPASTRQQGSWMQVSEGEGGPGGNCNGASISQTARVMDAGDDLLGEVAGSCCSLASRLLSKRPLSLSPSPTCSAPALRCPWRSGGLRGGSGGARVPELGATCDAGKGGSRGGGVGGIGRRGAGGAGSSNGVSFSLSFYDITAPV